MSLNKFQGKLEAFQYQNTSIYSTRAIPALNCLPITPTQREILQLVNTLDAEGKGNFKWCYDTISERLLIPYQSVKSAVLALKKAGYVDTNTKKNFNGIKGGSRTTILVLVDAILDDINKLYQPLLDKIKTKNTARKGKEETISTKQEVQVFDEALYQEIVSSITTITQGLSVEYVNKAKSHYHNLIESGKLTTFSKEEIERKLTKSAERERNNTMEPTTKETVQPTTEPIQETRKKVAVSVPEVVNENIEADKVELKSFIDAFIDGAEDKSKFVDWKLKDAIRNEFYGKIDSGFLNWNTFNAPSTNNDINDRFKKEKERCVANLA